MQKVVGSSPIIRSQRPGIPGRTCGVLDARGAGVRRDRALAVVLPAYAHSERIDAEYLLDRSCPRRLPDALALDYQTIALADIHASSHSPRPVGRACPATVPV